MDCCQTELAPRLDIITQREGQAQSSTCNHSWIVAELSRATFTWENGQLSDLLFPACRLYDEEE